MQISDRERRLQVGHAVGGDERDKYGWKRLTEEQARKIANAELNPNIDLAMYYGLDFDRLAWEMRRKGWSARREFGTTAYCC